jgi:hypothetical protein
MQPDALEGQSDSGARQSWSIVIAGFGVGEADRAQALEMARATVRHLLGGDTKFAEKALGKLAHAIDVVPDEHPPELDGQCRKRAALRWELDIEREARRHA